MITKEKQVLSSVSVLIVYRVPCFATFSCLVMVLWFHLTWLGFLALAVMTMLSLSLRLITKVRHRHLVIL